MTYNHSTSIDYRTILVESLLTGDPLDIQANQHQTANCKKEAKGCRNYNQLDRLAKLKQGVNQNTARQIDQYYKFIS